MKPILKAVLSIIAFIAASGATYVAIRKWNAVEQMSSVKQRHDTLEGVNGPSEGDIVTLPALTNQTGKEVNLGNLKEERLLCVFIGSQCSGCTIDADMWRDLKEESGKRGVAFYLVDVVDDLAELERFSSAYNLQELPLLFDPKKKVGPELKVGFLPQYVLFTREGMVLHRWDGIRHYDKSAGAQQLAEFFEPH